MSSRVNDVRGCVRAVYSITVYLWFSCSSMAVFHWNVTVPPGQITRFAAGGPRVFSPRFLSLFCAMSTNNVCSSFPTPYHLPVLLQSFLKVRSIHSAPVISHGFGTTLFMTFSPRTCRFLCAPRRLLACFNLRRVLAYLAIGWIRLSNSSFSRSLSGSRNAAHRLSRLVRVSSPKRLPPTAS